MPTRLAFQLALAQREIDEITLRLSGLPTAPSLVALERDLRLRLQWIAEYAGQHHTIAECCRHARDLVVRLITRPGDALLERHLRDVLAQLRTCVESAQQALDVSRPYFATGCGTPSRHA